MEYGHLPGIDTPVARLIMGTMVCTTDNMPLTRELLDAYVATGGNCLDTAVVYAGGRSEAAVGQWMRERENRDRLVIVAKGAHPKADGAPRVTPEAIEEDIEASLERMQTDRFDLYLLHRDDPEAPVGPIVRCLDDQVRRGRIRAFGGSNWTHRRVAEANQYAAEHGLMGFAASSPYMGLAVPNEPMWQGCVHLDAEAKRWHEETGFPALAWSSQAGGLFTGRYHPDDRRNADMVRVYYSDANWERVRRCRVLAGERGCTPNQIALAYVLCHPFPVFALIGPRSPSELRDSVGALTIDLTSAERSWLNLEA